MSPSRRKAALTAAALSALAPALAPAAASAGIIAPDSPASSNADATQTMYWIGLVVTVAVIVAIAAALLRAVLARRGEGEGEGRTRGTGTVQRRVGAAIGAAALVLFVVGIVFTERARDVEASQAKPIAIEVTGQQWLWRYEYPEAEPTTDGFSANTPYSYYDLVVPVDTPITLNIGSTDVIHRWWVPQLARSVDAVPGEHQSVTFVADEEGTYDGRSTEFSGPGYATMRTAVHVVSEDEYKSFLAQRIKDIKDARAAVQARVDDGSAPGVALESRGEGK